MNYDLENWIRIADAIRTDVPSVSRVSRAQIIDDALALAKGGYLDYPTALAQIDYMAQEMDYIPWSAASSNTGYLQAMMAVSYKESFPCLNLT